MEPRARFGIVFLPESLADFGALCREAEEAGFDLLGVADSQSQEARQWPMSGP